MQEPTLVIMAAGMGSRFGGLKQITAVDPQGHAIIDFSLFDAYRAGFRRVVFIIKRAIEEDFKSAVGSRMERYFDVKYVRQELDCLPDGFAVPEGRQKPWGTGHAVACCSGVVNGPFAVINSDDFYGAGAYKAIFSFLNDSRGENQHAMVGYRLRNTVTESGYVSRGICTVDGGYLSAVTERTHIEKRGSGAVYTENGASPVPLSGDEIVSMNFWGFNRGIFTALLDGFPDFLRRGLAADPLKCEYFLPSVVNEQIAAGSAGVRVLECGETWHGVTYKQDLEDVCRAIAALKAKGVYPDRLWDEL